jgi:hypothetical protein
MPPVRYSRLIVVRVDEALGDAVQVAAARQGKKPSEFIRGALRSELQAEGFAPIREPAE